MVLCNVRRSDAKDCSYGDRKNYTEVLDGRYMDRINAVYIYDGKDTWTDESGVEWNKAIK